MSRTRHHKEQRKQHMGDDLWSRRPCAGKSYSTYNKRLTARKERAAEPEILRQEIEGLDDTNHGCCYVCGVPHAWEPDETECEEYVIFGLCDWEDT